VMKEERTDSHVGAVAEQIRRRILQIGTDEPGFRDAPACASDAFGADVHPCQPEWNPALAVDGFEKPAAADAFLERLHDAIRLLVDLLEHEMPIAAFVRGVGGHLALADRPVHRLAVRIDDSSGELEVSGVGDARIDDSSGSMEVADVSGSVEIRDGSGSIDVRRVGGDVRIRDGSGSIEVERVAGSVVVEDDGAGSIRISDVDRDVRVDEDGSGSIEVRRVGGGLRVGRDGSGGIRYGDVTGEVDVPER